MTLTKLKNEIIKRTGLTYGRAQGDFWIRKFYNCYTVYIEAVNNEEVLDKITAVCKELNMAVDYVHDIIGIYRDLD